MRRLRPVVAAAILTSARTALGACTGAATGPSFGTYDLFATAPLDAAGAVIFECSSPAEIQLSPGSSGSYASRTMQSGPAHLAYNLYANAGRTQVWGDGSGGTATRRAGPGNRQSLPIFGRIPPLQDAASGSYSDTLIVTILF